MSGDHSVPELEGAASSQEPRGPFSLKHKPIAGGSTASFTLLASHPFNLTVPGSRPLTLDVQTDLGLCDI